MRLAKTLPGHPQGQPAKTRAPAGGMLLTQQQVPASLASALMLGLAGPEFFDVLPIDISHVLKTTVSLALRKALNKGWLDPGSCHHAAVCQEESKRTEAPLAMIARTAIFLDP